MTKAPQFFNPVKALSEDGRLLTVASNIDHRDEYKRVQSGLRGGGDNLQASAAHHYAAAVEAYAFLKQQSQGIDPTQDIDSEVHKAEREKMATELMRRPAEAQRKELEAVMKYAKDAGLGKAWLFENRAEAYTDDLAYLMRDFRFIDNKEAVMHAFKDAYYEDQYIGRDATTYRQNQQDYLQEKKTARANLVIEPIPESAPEVETTQKTAAADPKKGATTPTGEVEEAKPVDLSTLTPEAQAAKTAEQEANTNTTGSDAQKTGEAAKTKDPHFNEDYHARLNKDHKDLDGKTVTIDKGDGTSLVVTNALEMMHLLGEEGYKKMCNCDPNYIAQAEEYSGKNFEIKVDGKVVASYAASIETVNNVKAREAVKEAPQLEKISTLKPITPSISPEEQAHIDITKIINDRATREVTLDRIRNTMVNNPKHFSNANMRRFDETAAEYEAGDGGLVEFEKDVYQALNGSKIDWADKDGVSPLEKLAIKNQTAHNTKPGADAPIEFASIHATIAKAAAGAKAAIMELEPPSGTKVDVEALAVQSVIKADNYAINTGGIQH
ncbi:MAG: hypothetical protein P8P30_07850 [Rickettsiales bacterium]|nr:hypothetical protein [Rickettsiales bacterium]